MPTFKRILIAIDGSDHANRAIDYAADLAARYDAELVLLHVLPRTATSQIPHDLQELAKAEHMELTEREILRGVAENILEAAEQRARTIGVTRIETMFDLGSPAEVIVNNARLQQVDLIVMGRRGLGSLSGLLMGSVSNKVSHLSECPCMTVL